MSNIAVLGAALGDEAKGRVTHWLSPQYDWVIRFGGGANAGHTIYRDGKKFVHNLLPSVDFRNPNIKAYLGAGMVIDLRKLRDEVLAAEEAYPGSASRIYVDREAFMVLDEHIEEDKQTNAHIGSTNRGVGPAYRDKVARKGIRIDDMWGTKRFGLNKDYDNALYHLMERGVNFTHVLSMEKKMKSSKLLFEGAQGILLDINHGIYPYVSCGDATIGGIYASGFGFAKIDKVYGIAKVYATKVGTGPFPTEVQGKLADDLRIHGNEFGSTTGRPRRIGWLDIPALRYACQKGNITDLILTKFDILDGMEQVPVCVSYDGTQPVCPSDFFHAKPTYENVQGWNDCFIDSQLEPFISKVEHHSGVSVSHISCGTGEHDIRRL